MSDDEADPELLELLRKSLGISSTSNEITSDTKVLSDAKFVYDNSVDVAVGMQGTKSAALMIWEQMQSRRYSTQTWSEHELHPKAKDEATLNFIFVMDLLNFSFWSEKSEEDRFAVEYRGQKWTGYWSLVACLQRALEEILATDKSLPKLKIQYSYLEADIPITTPSFYADEEECSDEKLAHVFRSSTEEKIPLLEERIACLREAGAVLDDCFEGSISRLVEAADRSAGKLVNLLAHHFISFNDCAKFERRTVRIMKRPQILVADIWAAFNSESYGQFDDIDNITMFADYRVPQMLHSLQCLSYSPPLDAAIRTQQSLQPGCSWEVQLRGCSIWTVELIKREILKQHSDAKVNAILIDFFLYDLAKEREKEGQPAIPHHRTRSIWY